MSIEMILQDYLTQPKLELGDRSLYVGASDVAQCPRKVVLAKTEPAPQDLQTLIRFERGNMVERIVANALDYAGIAYDQQVEVSHPAFPHFKAHLDFVFYRQDEIAVLETKSVSRMPDMPYPSWIEQVHFQMGLVGLSDARPVRGAVLAVDLSSGKFKLFDDYQPNRKLFDGLLSKAEHIWQAINGEVVPDTEESNLCVGCDYQETCPEFVGQDVVELPIKTEVEQYLSLKKNLKAMKEEADALKAIIQEAVKPFGEARAGDHSIKLRSSSRAGFDTKAFMADHPALYDEYKKVNHFTRLYVK